MCKKTVSNGSPSVPYKIFEEPNVKMRLTQIIIWNNESFRERFNEIRSFINDPFLSCDELSYKQILSAFKKEFCKKVVLYASENIFAQPEKISNGNSAAVDFVLNALSKENYLAAIMDKTLIKVFQDALRSITVDAALERACVGACIYNLEQRFVS